MQERKGEKNNHICFNYSYLHDMKRLCTAET